MPEPNLPPLRVNLNTKDDTPDVVSVPALFETLPELPEKSRQKLIEIYDLKAEIAIQLVNEPILLNFFLELVTVPTRNPTKVANLLINDLLTALNKSKLDVEDCSITVTQFGEITDLLLDKKISLEICRQIFDELLNCNSEINISDFIKEKGWYLLTDKDEIHKSCLQVIENNPKLVKQYKEGKVKVLKALLGILVKNTQSKLDMSLAPKIMEDLLKKSK